MRSSHEKSNSLKPTPQSSLKQINKIRFFQISSLMSMNALLKPSKKKLIQTTPKKTFKSEINKVLTLIKINKQKRILSEKLNNLVEKKSKIVKNIFYFQRISYNKILSKISPYISKKANSLVVFRNFGCVEAGCVDYPRRYFAFLTGYILEKKRCRLYNHYKDLQYLIDPKEFCLKYFLRLETKTVMNFLLNCCYNNDPTTYNYDIDLYTDIPVVKNNFDIFYKNKLKNIEKTKKKHNKINEYIKKIKPMYVKDIKYYNIPNIIPNLFLQDKEITRIMKDYLKKKKFEKIKSKYLNIFQIPSKFDKIRKITEKQEILKTPKNFKNSQISRTQYRENNNLLLDSDLYVDNSADNNYYYNNKINEFNCELKTTNTYKNDNTIDETVNLIKKIDLYDGNCMKKNNVVIKAKKIQNRKSVQFDFTMGNNDLTLNQKSVSKSNLTKIKFNFMDKNNNKRKSRLKTSLDIKKNESNSSIKKTKDKTRTKTAIISPDINNKIKNITSKKLNYENNNINIFNKNYKIRTKINLKKKYMISRENLESANENFPFLNKKSSLDNKIKVKTNISNLYTTANLSNWASGNNSDISINNINNCKPPKYIYNLINNTENKIRTVTLKNLDTYSNNRYSLKNSSEFIQRKKTKDQIFKTQYSKLKSFIEYSINKRNNENVNKHFILHSENKKKRYSHKNYFKLGDIENEWGKGRDDDMIYQNLYTATKVMKKNYDLDRKHKNIFKNLTTTKDIVKFGDIYVH